MSEQEERVSDSKSQQNPSNEEDFTKLLPYDHLLAICLPLLEVWSDLHEVFTYEPVFGSDKKTRDSLRFLYRSWKKNVVKIIPGFDLKRFRQEMSEDEVEIKGGLTEFE